MVQQHGLTWGIFDFVDKTPTADGYVAEAIADGTDFGKVESEYELVQSLLRDGALSVRGKRKNRTITIRLRFSAPSVDAGPALAAAEKALMLQAGMDQPPPLAYTPAATDAVTSFYDVVIAEDPEWDSKSSMDLEEAMCEHRYFAHPAGPALRPTREHGRLAGHRDPAAESDHREHRHLRLADRLDVLGHDLASIWVRAGRPGDERRDQRLHVDPDRVGHDGRDAVPSADHRERLVGFWIRRVCRYSRCVDPRHRLVDVRSAGDRAVEHRRRGY